MTDGYFFIIPAIVADDPNITDAEALLYGRLNSLTRKSGFATASNGYLGKQVIPNRDEKTISRMISKLKKHGYIKTFVDGPSGNRRKIWTLETMANYDKTKDVIAIDENITSYPQDNHEVVTNKSLGSDDIVNKLREDTKIRKYNTPTPNSGGSDEGIQYVDLAGKMLDYFNLAFGNSFPQTSKGMLTPLIMHGVDYQSFVDTVNWIVTTWPVDKRSNFKPSTLAKLNKFDDWNDTAVAKGFSGSKELGEQQLKKSEDESKRKEMVSLQNHRVKDFDIIHDNFYKTYQLITNFIDMPPIDNDSAWDALLNSDQQAFDKLKKLVEEREANE